MRTSLAFVQISLHGNAWMHAARKVLVAGGVCWTALHFVSMKGFLCLHAGKLKDLVAAAPTKEDRIALLGYEASYGSLDGFKVELSTLPGQAGKSLLHAPLSLSEVKGALDESKALMLGALPPKGGWKRLA